jgi:hypothetical protein
VTTIARRRLIALTVAYAVALQAVLSSFAMLTMAGHAAQGICASAASGTLPGPLLPASRECIACPILCGGMALAGIAPPDVAVPVPPPRSSGVAGGAAPWTLPAAQRLLPPPRAPPAA